MLTSRESQAEDQFPDTADDISFRQWMRQVDVILIAEFGVGSADLPDIMYRDLFDDGTSAEYAAKEAIRNAGGPDEDEDEIEEDEDEDLSDDDSETDEDEDDEDDEEY